MSERQLQEALSQAERGSTICLDAIAVTLTHPLVVNVPNVTIEGSAESRTTIRCPENGSSGAFVIRHVLRSQIW